MALVMWLSIPALVLARRYRGREAVRVVPYAASWAAAHRERSPSWILGVYVAIALEVVALARPQLKDDLQTHEQRGYDLMLAVDLSTSMLSEDYVGPHGPVNRLDTIRPVIQQFIRQRVSDRIGIVVFAERAMTLSPLTTDHASLERAVAGLRVGLVKDGTAIGDAIGTALNDIEIGHKSETPVDNATAASAFVVLLTDGSNNTGALSPAEATMLARYRKIPVYAVGTGRNGKVPFPVLDSAGHRIGTTIEASAIDIEALRTIAAQTGGQLFMAGDTAGLRQAFGRIDQARKANFHLAHVLRVRELFAPFAAGALLALALAAPGLMRTRQPLVSGASG